MNDQQKIKLKDLPDRARVKGLGPIGITWWATWNKSLQRFKPDENCPIGEFAPLEYKGLVIDVPENDNYQTYL